jgi:hypothetical protein
MPMLSITRPKQLLAKTLQSAGLAVVIRLADATPVPVALAIETNSRWRRHVRIACGETGLTDLLLRHKRTGLSFEAISQSLALSDLSIRLLLVLSEAFKLLRRDSVSGRYIATRRLFLEVQSGMYPLFEASPAFLSQSLKAGTNSALCILPGSGATLYERLATYPTLEEAYLENLAFMNKKERIPLVLASIAKLEGQVSHILDLGGSVGTTAAAIADAYPHLQVTVFDLPSVCEKGRATCTNKSVNFLAGNLAVDPLPQQADCVILSAVLEVMPAEEVRHLMRKIYDALPNGGSVIIVQAFIDERKTSPIPTALAAWYFFNVCAPSPMSVCLGDMKALAAEAGFASFEFLQIYRNPLAAMIMRKQIQAGS